MKTKEDRESERKKLNKKASDHGKQERERERVRESQRESQYTMLSLASVPHTVPAWRAAHRGRPDVV